MKGYAIVISNLIRCNIRKEMTGTEKIDSIDVRNTVSLVLF